MVWLLPYPICVGLYAIASAFPGMTEARYSLGVYQGIRSALLRAVGSWPFSVAEFAVYAIAALAFARIASGVAAAARSKGRRLRELSKAAYGLVAAAGAISLAFVVMWGLNNCRLPISEAAGIDVRPASAGELEEACRELLARASALRGGGGVAEGDGGFRVGGVAEGDGVFRVGGVAEGDGGVMALDGGKASALRRAHEGFAPVAARFPSLGQAAAQADARVRPKPVLASKLMSYGGITGIFFPMTGEANVDMDILDVEAPFVMCHELAHQFGYAREDEASFIAWLACDASPYADFRYSGNLMAFLHLMGRLHEADPGRHGAVWGSCPPGVARDLAAVGAYWAAHEGVASDASAQVNDAFLKINGQQEGVASYGRMADLVIGYLRGA